MKEVEIIQTKQIGEIQSCNQLNRRHLHTCLHFLKEQIRFQSISLEGYQISKSITLIACFLE
ncbi:hypothetical protein Hanom_Chr12g01092581 [Helianthus anomalus]